MNGKIERVVLLIGALFSVFLFTGCASSSVNSGDPASKTAGKAITIKLGTPNASGNMGGIAGIANEKGFIAEELEQLGYTFEVVGFAGAGPAVNEALIGGSIDYAILADFPAITAKAKGVDTTLIAIENSLSNCALAVSPKASYQRIEDLVGKKIAIPKGTYMQRFFVLLVEEKGLSEKDFEIIQMTNDMESALISGSVDAILFTSDNINKCVYINKTARIIENTLDYPEYSGQSLFVGRTKSVDEHPQAAAAILKGLLRAVDYALENPEEAAGVLAAAGSSSNEVIEATYGFAGEGAGERYILELTDGSRQKLDRTKTFLLEHGLIANDFNISDWYRPINIITPTR